MESRGAGIALVAALLAACGGAAPPPAPKAVEVTFMDVAPRPATVNIDYVGQIEAVNTVEVRPRVGGLLEKQAAVEGQRVARGQVLFQIDQQPYIAAVANAKASLAQAQAALDQSERDHARVEPLSELNAVSQQELDAIVARNNANKALVDAARAGLRTAQLNLEYTTVTSPIDGIVGRAQLRTGGLVTAYSSLLTTVYATDSMYVNFSISEQRMLELQHRWGGRAPGAGEAKADFKLELADGSEYPHPATLNLVDAAIDRATGTLPVRLEVPNPEQLLRAGQFARVVVSAQHIDNALLVPQQAVQELQGKTSLWVVGEDSHVQSREVKMGPRIGSDWLVLEGIEPGTRIVAKGGGKLRPGVAVTEASKKG
jgi:membrane fusion protein (multidrug efflux system)